jgi:DNA recombination protein RmuC
MWSSAIAQIQFSQIQLGQIQLASVGWAAVAVASALLAGAVGFVAGRATAAERVAGLREQLASARAAAGTDDAVLGQFRAVSGQAMAEQSGQLLRLAESRYQTLEQSSELRWRAQGEAVLSKLEEYAARLGRLEEQRQRESAVLSDAVGSLRRSNDELRAEARGLAGALRDNRVRGSWGEVQLRRVLEQAGMVAHADFVEQPVVAGGGRSARPDVVVRLPNGRRVVIDAKAPLDAFLRASACEDDAERAVQLADHARAVGSHVAALAARRYDELVEGSVDFVVLFVPGDAFLSAALDVRPDLFDVAADQDVILASPGTLLAFLRGVACGWRERQVADEAAEVAALGRELHERLVVFAEHFGSVGSALGRAVTTYNQALGSMERRLLVTARRLEDHAVGSRKDLPDLQGLVEVPGLVAAPDLLQRPPDVA